MTGPDLKKFVQDYKKIEHEAQSLIPTLGPAQLSKREWERVDRTDFQLSGIDEDGITFSTEYNDSCHCHPEYQKAHIHIKWKDIENSMKDLPHE